MASEYGIMTITDAVNMVGKKLLKEDDKGNRVYSDDFIEEQISRGERDVFSSVHGTYTSETITVAGKRGVFEMAALYIENKLIRDNVIKNQTVRDEKAYFKEYIEDTLTLKPEKDVNSLKSVNTIENATFGWNPLP